MVQTVSGITGLSLGTLCGSDSGTNDVLQENFQHLQTSSEMGFASLPSTRHLLGRRMLEQGALHAECKSALLFNLEKTCSEDVKSNCKQCLDAAFSHQLAALNVQQEGFIRKPKIFHHDSLLVSIDIPLKNWKGFCVLF